MKRKVLETTATSPESGDVQMIDKLVAIATTVEGSIASLGLHGKGQSGVQSRCATIRKGTDTTKRLNAGEELATSLRKGNPEALKLAAEILGVLKPASPPAVTVAAEPSADRSGKTETAPGAGDEEPASTTAPATPSERHKGEIVLMPIGDLKTEAPFNSLFPIAANTLSAIETDMRRNGYDNAHPGVGWLERHIVLDGHTRLQAAQKAGLTHMPVVFQSFKDEDEAIEYAIHCQRDRRNLTDADIMRLVTELDERRRRGGDRRGEGALGSKTSGEVFDSAAETAKLIGTSATKVEAARAVIDSGDETLKAAVRSGQKGIRRGAAEARAARRTPKQKAAAYLLARTKASKALKVAAEHLRKSDPAIADMIAMLRNAVLEIITRAKAEAKNGTKKTEVHSEAA